jgi:transcriptional regulator with XRE-family HTH domain
VEERTGLCRCYISRVENGHTVPAIYTLEKFASALGVPIYQLLYDGPRPPQRPKFKKTGNASGVTWGGAGRDARMFNKLRRLLSLSDESDRKLLMQMAQKMARRQHANAGKSSESNEVSRIKRVEEQKKDVELTGEESKGKL